MVNSEIRTAAKEANVKLWEIAEKLNLNDGNFSRKLRKEFVYEEKLKVLKIIEELMKKAGVSQEKLAEAIGASRQTVSLYQLGQSSPSWGGIRDIAKFFGVSSDYLLGLSEYKSRNTEELLAVDLGLSESAVQNLNDIYVLGKERGDNNCLARLALFSEFIAFSSNMFLLDSSVKYILASLPENQSGELCFKDSEGYPLSYKLDTAELLNILREIALNDIGKVLDKIREVGQKTWAEYKSGLELEGDE